MPYFTISVVLVITAFSLLGLFTSGRVKNASDYAVANRGAGPFSVAGVIMGSLVAGGSTIGTVQMAYVGGLSAWWFTLGSGLGCALLGLRFAGPMRRSNLTTLPELIERNYGYQTAFLTLIGSILGTLLSVVTQFQAGTALLRSVFPISTEAAVALISLMILAFIFLGGLKSFSVVGNVKTIVLYLLLILCCVKVALAGQTPLRLIRDMPFFPWFTPFGFGVGKGLGSCVSLISGILCTQIYMQAVFAASDERSARKGCLVAAFLIPPLGLMAIWIGLAVRNAGIEIEPAQVLPYFLLTYFHPLVSGALWAGLAITIVGGASGLCLGVATNMSLDIFLRLSRLHRDDKRVLLVSRIAVFLSVGIAAALGLAMRSVYILQLSYIGMGLRGAGMAVPLVAAVLKPGILTPACAFFSSLTGLASMLLAWIFLPNIEPLFVGLAVSLVPLFISISGRKYLG